MFEEMRSFSEIFNFGEQKGPTIFFLITAVIIVSLTAINILLRFLDKLETERKAKRDAMLRHWLNSSEYGVLRAGLEQIKGPDWSLISSSPHINVRMMFKLFSRDLVGQVMESVFWIEAKPTNVLHDLTVYIILINQLVSVLGINETERFITDMAHARHPEVQRKLIQLFEDYTKEVCAKQTLADSETVIKEGLKACGIKVK